MTPDPSSTPPFAAPVVPGRAAGDSALERPFYGWRILAAAVVTTILTGPGQTIGVSVFIDPMVDALGVSRSAVSSAYLIGTLAGASAMPTFGRFVDRNGVRRAQIVIGFAFAAALVNMSTVQNLVWLAIGFGGIRMMGQGALSMIPTVAVSLWFERRRGVAMGVLATVAGTGIVAVPIALNAVIGLTGWRGAWLVAAATIVLTVVPIAWFVLVDRPSDIGQTPDGLPTVQAAAEATDTEPSDAESSVGRTGGDSTTTIDSTDAPTHAPIRSLTRADAMRTRQFWILASVGFTVGMLITGLNFHQIDLLGEAGLSSGEAAAMFLPQIVGSSISGITIGYVIDRIGIRFVPALAIALLVLVHVIAAAMQPGLIIFVYAVSLGATGGVTRAVLSTLLPGYFGTDHIGAIQGVMTVSGVAGSAVGPVALAVAQEQTGSYRTANLTLIVLPLVALLFTLTNRSTVSDSR